ncbi:hypothetical protein LIER_20825 [Lithospermum erythrorhizon]|uniref:Uncharacterized protein n=1 Tax=Lithospermum erythrorhizon TaxID=34254 RepID=A0AAV3QQR6_LITER
MSKNFLADSCPNKVQSPVVLCSRRYGSKGSNLVDRLERTNVWEAIQKAADPTKVEVAAMKGKRLPRFSSQLVVRKPLIYGVDLIPVFPSKRSSTSEGQVEQENRHRRLHLPFAPPRPSFLIWRKLALAPKRVKGRVLLRTRSKAPCTIPNGLSVSEGHLFNKRMEAFHAALNAQYAATRREAMRDLSSEKREMELEAARVSLKERVEELNSAKSALSPDGAGEVEDQSSLTKDVEDSRSARLEAINRAEVAKARPFEAETRLSQFDEEVAQRVAEFKDSEEGDLFFNGDWPEEYFEGLSVVTPLIEAPGETTEVADQGGEIAEGEVATADDEGAF